MLKAIQHYSLSLFRTHLRHVLDLLKDSAATPDGGGDHGGGNPAHGLARVRR